jgi:hypothetical protein
MHVSSSSYDTAEQLSCLTLDFGVVIFMETLPTSRLRDAYRKVVAVPRRVQQKFARVVVVIRVPPARSYNAGRA